LLFAGYSLGNVLMSDYRQRAGQAELGRWACHEFGPSSWLLGPAGAAHVVSYYAQARFVLFDPDANDRAIEEIVEQGSYSVVLLPDDHESLHGRRVLLRHLAGLGYTPVDDQPFSGKLRKMAVLARRKAIAKN
jgi:hypothetical protein